MNQYSVGFDLDIKIEECQENQCLLKSEEQDMR